MRSFQSTDAPNYAPTFCQLSTCRCGHCWTLKIPRILVNHSSFCAFGERPWTFSEGCGRRGLVPQRGFEPLTHALRIRRSFWRCLSINVLRTPNAIFVGKRSGKSACAGTKVGTVICVSQTHHSHPGTNPPSRIIVPISRAVALSIARA
jgi:hypothetical protein